MKRRLLAVLAVFLANTALPALVVAAPLTSPNYKLDPQGLNAVGGQGSSTNYRMVSSGGEAVVGSGSGGSYKLSSGYVGALQQSIELNLTESNLQAYYPLNTSTGIQAYDATANNNNGIFTNGPTWATGKIAGGVSLDGLNDYISVKDTANLKYSGGDITLSAWVSPTTASDAGYILSKAFNGSGNYNYRILHNAGGTITFLLGGATAYSLTTVTTAPISQWTHVAVVVNSASLVKIYINGVEAASGTHAISNWIPGGGDGNLPLAIGTLYPYGEGWAGVAAQAFAGVVDETRILNRALSATEVRNMYDANMAGIANSVTIPQVVPGVPQTVGMDMTVITDAGGYNAAISQNNNLTHSDAATTIAALSGGNITTPVLWDDGTTKGLGFTVIGGLSVPAKWGSGPVNYKYAALPGSATTFFSRTGLSGGQKEVTNLQFKLDVPTSQKSGQYTNIATVTATLKP